MNNIEEVPVIAKSKGELAGYRKLNPAVFKKLTAISRTLNGQNVIHINATSKGGGVAEILSSQVALEKSLGLKSRWFVMRAQSGFFNVTKKIHNLLQGKPGRLTPAEKEVYLAVCRDTAGEVARILSKLSPGIVVIHDPQPLALISSIPQHFYTILRLHIDLSAPNPLILEWLRPWISKYRALIISHAEYKKALPWLPAGKIKIVPPAIDPISEKNRPVPLAEAKNLLFKKMLVSPQKPLISQVSRFDPWKDPIGVIRAYYLAKNKIPELLLILAGSFAADDPEGHEIFRLVEKHARGDPDIFLWTKHDPKIINAIQTASDVVIQKSLREGFGLTITEAMWKGKAVVAGFAQGPLTQIRNGKNGVLVSSPENAARAIVRLIKNERLRRRLGAAARRSVAKCFLLPRFALKNFKIYKSFLYPAN